MAVRYYFALQWSPEAVRLRDRGLGLFRLWC